MRKRKDFMIVIIAYLVGAIAIMMIVPIGKTWLYVGIFLFIISVVLQWYWNKHFKENK